MIDWPLVLRNFLWIAGASILVAAWSHHHWLATVSPQSRAEVFHGEAWAALSAAGSLLFCLGQALLPGRWWEHVAWSVLTLWITFDGSRRWRSRR